MAAGASLMNDMMGKFMGASRKKRGEDEKGPNLVNPLTPNNDEAKRKRDNNKFQNAETKSMVNLNSYFSGR